MSLVDLIRGKPKTESPRHVTRAEDSDKDATFWRVRFAARNLEVSVFPASSREEVLSECPGALSVEPIPTNEDDPPTKFRPFGDEVL